MKRFLAAFSPADVVTIGFLLFLILLNLVFHARVEMWLELTAVNVVVIIGIVLLAQAANRKQTPLLTGVHRWYLYPAVLLIFKELYFIIRPIHPVDYDDLLIQIDRWVFGTDPTVWLAQFAHPVLTEILQIAYWSYYLLFIILGVEIYRRHTLKSFDKAGFLIVYGFYLSYLGYFFLPAVGPRFTLHDFSLMDQELPGLLLAVPLRDFINAAESIPAGNENPVDYVQRDVFPSGHTQLSLIVVYLAFHFRLHSRWILTVLTGLLIVGTVYLRYHYFVDLIAGALLFAFTVWSGRHLELWWNDLRYSWRSDDGLLETRPEIR
ncbi:MAG: phosphatase PAP2 family protein [Ignavibacteriales bacterium]|nr:phosphatase PAP2 family protein [Ignavibacteriales bacterium]